MSRTIRLAPALIGLAAWMIGAGQARAVSVGEPAPEIAGESWINGPPLTTGGLRGRVLLIDFWTFG